MRGLAIGLCCVLEGALAGCYLAHERPPLDAGVAPDAFRERADAYARRIDAWTPPRDAWAAPDAYVVPDAFRDRDAYVAPDAWVERFDAGPPRRSGYLVVGQERNDSLPPFDYLTASFSDVSPEDLRRHLYDANCTFLEMSGDCQLVSCSDGADSYEAGAIVVTDRTGTVIEAPSRTYTNTHPRYLDYFATRLGRSIPGGDLLHIDVSGGDVPPFDVDIVMPPWLAAVMPRSVSRTTDWVVTWPPIEDANVWVGLEPPSGSSRLIVQCLVPGSAGTVTVPSALISYFEVGEDISTFASSMRALYVQSGVYLIEVSAFQGRVHNTIVRD
jgi:hypothetical protein